MRNRAVLLYLTLRHASIALSLYGCNLDVLAEGLCGVQLAWIGVASNGRQSIPTAVPNPIV